MIHYPTMPCYISPSTPRPRPARNVTWHGGVTYSRREM
jgi:hypothetical protein